EGSRRQARPQPSPRAATRRGAGGAARGGPPTVQALAPECGSPALEAAAGGAAEGDVAAHERGPVRRRHQFQALCVTVPGGAQVNSPPSLPGGDDLTAMQPGAYSG